MTKIAILDDLEGTRVTCVMDDGSEVTGVLKGVSHQDDWDELILAGIPPFRSSAVTKIYVEAQEGLALVWPEGAEDDSEVRELLRAATRVGFDPILYQQAIGLMDRVVKVVLDDGAEEVGRLEAVTPHVPRDEGLHTDERLPTLHVGQFDDGDNSPTRIVQLSAVVSIETHVLTHDEADEIITEEGRPEPDETAPTVESQREQAETAHGPPQHSQADTARAFGLPVPIAACSEHLDGCPQGSHADDIQSVDAVIAPGELGTHATLAEAVEEETKSVEREVEGMQTPEDEVEGQVIVAPLEGNYGPPNPPPEGAVNSDTCHTHGDEEHGHEDGGFPHEHPPSEETEG